MANHPSTSAPKRFPALLFIQSAVILALGLGWFWWTQAHRPAPAEQKTIVQRVVEKVASVGSLDRPTALELLHKAPGLVPGDTEGVFVSGAPSQKDALTSFLASAGFVSCERVCTLTAKGKAQNWPSAPIAGSTDYKVEIPLATANVERVTGIQSGLVGLAVGQAAADFTYTVEPNAIGKALLAYSAGRKFCGTNYAKKWAANPHTGQAVFSRYDDGFRLMSSGSSTSVLFDPYSTACYSF